MKKFFLMTILVILSACSVIRREAGYPGGNIGYYANENLYQAYLHEQRVDRSLLMLAVLAPLAAETARSKEDAVLSIESVNVVYKGLTELAKITQACDFLKNTSANRQIGRNDITEPTDAPVGASVIEAVTDLAAKTYGQEKVENPKKGKLIWNDGLNYSTFFGEFTEVPKNEGHEQMKYRMLRGHIAIADGGNATEPDCTVEKVKSGSVYEFETHNLAVQKALFRLLRASADNLGIKLEKARASNVTLKNLWQLLRNARRTMPLLVDYLATFRDVTVIYAAAVDANCRDNKDPRQVNCSKLMEFFDKGLLHERADQIAAGLAAEDLYRPINRMMKLATTAAETDVKSWRIKRVQREALLRHIELACQKLGKEAEINEDTDTTGCTVYKKDGTSLSKNDRAKESYKELTENWK